MSNNKVQNTVLIVLAVIGALALIGFLGMGLMMGGMMGGPWLIGLLIAHDAGVRDGPDSPRHLTRKRRPIAVGTPD